VLPGLLGRLAVLAVVDERRVDQDRQDVEDVREQVGVVGQVDDASRYDLEPMFYFVC
jgi:hypothetical protein